MNVAAAGAGRGVDDSAPYATVLDRVGAGEHLELPQCLDPKKETGGASRRVGVGIGDVNAIDHVVVHLRANPIDRDSQTTTAAWERRDRLAHALELQDTGLERRQLHERARVQGQVANNSLVHQELHGGAGDVDR